MNEDEKRQMLASLEKGREALVDALAGVGDETARRSPGPGRWTVLECMEHVAMAEDGLFRQILMATLVDVAVINPKREAAIPVRGLDRTRPIACPESGLPVGRFPALQDALDHFLASRERTIQFVEESGEDLRSKMTTHPVMGAVNCYEVLLSMAVHPLRHVGQIEEIKAAIRTEP
jgi:uncharacterized damage-inducible protein DinB